MNRLELIISKQAECSGKTKEEKKHIAIQENVKNKKLNKQAFGPPAAGAAAGAVRGLGGLGTLLVGLGLVGVPSLAAYLGYTQAEAESKLLKDKEFEARRRQLGIYDEGIDALKSQRYD